MNNIEENLDYDPDMIFESPPVDWNAAIELRKRIYGE